MARVFVSHSGRDNAVAASLLARLELRREPGREERDPATRGPRS